MKQFKYIGSISEVELKSNVVHACINEDGFRCILIKNAEEKTVISKYDTDNLGIRMNTVLVFNDTNYYFHIVTAKKNNQESNVEFELVYDYIFRKIQEPILDTELAKLVLSIEEYFRITPQRDNRQLQIGVWGELFCIKKLYNSGYKHITEKYHNNFFLRHDVEISKKLRMEIKTSVNQKRIHHFRHEQICRNDIEIIVASLIVEEVQQGTSLFQFFNDIFDIVSDPEDRLALHKTMKLCGVSEENHGLIFSEEKAKEDIRFYDAKTLPMLKTDIPQGVSKIEYEVDCALGIPIDINIVVDMLLAESE